MFVWDLDDIGNLLFARLVSLDGSAKRDNVNGCNVFKEHSRMLQLTSNVLETSRIATSMRRFGPQFEAHAARSFGVYKAHRTTDGPNLSAASLRVAT